MIRLFVNSYSVIGFCNANSGPEKNIACKTPNNSYFPFVWLLLMLPSSDGVPVFKPPLAGRRVCHLWSAGGHLGREAQWAHPLLYMGSGQYSLCQVQPHRGKTWACLPRTAV